MEVWGNKDVCPSEFLFCMRELLEEGKRGIFFALTLRFLGLFSALLKTERAYKLTPLDDSMHSENAFKSYILT